MKVDHMSRWRGTDEPRFEILPILYNQGNPDLSSSTNEWVRYEIGGATLSRTPNFFNPLALESGWKAAHASKATIQVTSFNPLALESGWKVVSWNMHYHTNVKFQSACAGEWLESHSRLMRQTWAQSVSIRLRWRVVGKLILIEAYELESRFNPLALESGWKEDGEASHSFAIKFQSACAGEWLERKRQLFMVHSNK